MTEIVRTVKVTMKDRTAYSKKYRITGWNWEPVFTSFYLEDGCTINIATDLIAAVIEYTTEKEDDKETE